MKPWTTPNGDGLTELTYFLVAVRMNSETEVTDTAVVDVVNKPTTILPLQNLFVKVSKLLLTALTQAVFAAS